VLRESQPFRALLGAFMLQGLATGLMLAGAQFVATWVLRDEGAVTVLFISLIAPALLLAPVWRRISDRIGKERAFRLASFVFLVATVALVGMTWAPGWWVVAPVALAGAAYAGMQSLPMAMLPDVISVADGSRERIAFESPAGAAAAAAHGAKRGADGSRERIADEPRSRAGVFGGVWTAGETIGMALGATVLTVVLALTGYVESSAGVQVQQPGTAVAGIALSFSLLPAVLMLLSLLVLGRYRLRQADIEAARAGGADDSAGRAGSAGADGASGAGA
jgi:Na+/melibiose symporter-like transporter